MHAFLADASAAFAFELLCLFQALDSMAIQLERHARIEMVSESTEVWHAHLWHQCLIVCTRAAKRVRGVRGVRV